MPKRTANGVLASSVYQRDLCAANLESLPDEILSSIVYHLDLPDIHNLRLTSRNLHGTCNDWLRKHFTILYLHPTRTSMKQLLDICYNGLYADYIEELCILGDPMWQEIEQAHRGYRAGQEQECDHRGCREWYNDILASQEFKAWPCTYGPFHDTRKMSAAMPPATEETSAKRGKKASFSQALLEKVDGLSNCVMARTPASNREVARRGTEFETCYKLLLDALNRLSRVHRLTYKTAPASPGLNVVSTQLVESHSRATRTSKVNPTMISSNQAQQARRSDADVFYGILTSLKLRAASKTLPKITTVGYGSELPFCESFVQNMSLSPINPFSVSLSRLKRLDITMDCGWGITKSLRMYKHIIWAARSSLGTLRIKLVKNLVKTLPCEPVHYLLTTESGDALVPIDMPGLHHLEIIFRHDKHSQHLSREQSAHGSRWTRPPATLLHRNRFWEARLKTLTTLRLEYVVSYDESSLLDDDYLGIPRLMQRNLDFVKAFSHKLQHFDWIVPAFRHHPRCKSKNDALGVTCDRLACFNYEERVEAGSNIVLMESVAQELGVDFDEKSETWNFGDYLKLDIMARLAEDRQ